RAGCGSVAATGLFPMLATGGAVQTTAKTTPAGRTMATTKKTAKRMRTARERTAALRRLLFVREVLKLGGELAYPTPVVEAPDEAAVALVARHVPELLRRDEVSKASQVRVRTVPHDAPDDSGKLAPLPFRQRLAVACDGHQERRGGAGDRLRQELVRLRPRDDLAARADDVGDSITAYADDVAPTAYSGAFEVARTSFH